MTTETTTIAPAKRRRGHGEGSIIQRGDGRWAAVIDLGWVDGTWKRKTLYGKTRKDVADKMRTARREQEQGRDLTARTATVEAFMTRWLSEDVAPRLAPKTIEQYTILTTKHIVPSLGKVALNKLTAEQVTRFLRTKQASGLSASTVNHLQKILRTALNVAVDWKLLSGNPVAATRKVEGEQRKSNPLTPSEMTQFLDTIRDDEHETMYRVTLMLGLRIGETLGLRWQHVDLTGDQPWSVKRPCLRIEATLQRNAQAGGGSVLVLKTPKTRDSRRILPLPASLIPLLKAHRARQNERRLLHGDLWQDNDLVFTGALGAGIEPRQALRVFHAACGRAGIERRRLHDLRHSAATKLMADGLSLLEVSKLLGHSQLSTTFDIYGHILTEQMGGMVDRLDAAWGTGS